MSSTTADISPTDYLQRARQQQAKEPALSECGDDGLGQLAPAFDLVGGGG